jgi:hypothetical protein
MEIAGVVAPTPAMCHKIHGWTRIAVPIIALISALATEFTKEAHTAFEMAPGCRMGAFVPAVAYVTNRVLAVMYDR